MNITFINAETYYQKDPLRRRPPQVITYNLISFDHLFALIGYRDGAIAFLSLHTEPISSVMQKTLITQTWRLDTLVHTPSITQLSPDAPLVVIATPFQEKVWRELLTLEDGETTTYGKLAEKIGAPRAARAVGTAVGKNMIAVSIPCHRVIAQTGNRYKYRWGGDVKKYLLEKETGLLRHCAPRNDCDRREQNDSPKTTLP